MTGKTLSEHTGWGFISVVADVAAHRRNMRRTILNLTNRKEIYIMTNNNKKIVSIVDYTRQKRRLSELSDKINYHEFYIAQMLDLASHVKTPSERAKIAQEIGYIRIEIECHLKPLQERLMAY